MPPRVTHIMSAPFRHRALRGYQHIGGRLAPLVGTGADPHINCSIVSKCLSHH
ncbi:hypothetical protein RH449_003739 [Providencia stuartii]|uniref:hypothetical protein n=1 Tax=Providencia stuartii TaxID=588 RepID=UPI002EDCA666